jgi:low affinity Fe/Cu permease
MSALNGMHVKGYHAVHPGRACRGHRFDRMSIWTARAAGCRWGFRLAVLLILAWVAAGPLVNYHKSWTTIFTVTTTSVMFLLVFLIQNVQNRELKAVHLKLDELILSAKHARNELIDVEYLTEEQLDRLGRRYSKLAELHLRLSKRSEGQAIPAVAEGTDRASPVVIDEQGGGDGR